MLTAGAGGQTGWQAKGQRTRAYRWTPNQLVLPDWQASTLDQHPTVREDRYCPGRIQRGEGVTAKTPLVSVTVGLSPATEGLQLARRAASGKKVRMMVLVMAL